MLRRTHLITLQEALQDTPAVMVIGPRQSGKSTLCKEVSRPYVTLDDPFELSRAKSNPGDFLDSLPPQVTIDEIQRAPELMLPLKLRIDNDRSSGRFLLTGSANVLTLPKVADSLAGRIEVIELAPLTQAELEGSQSRFIEKLFGEGWAHYSEWGLDALETRIARGGFPEPALRPSQARRNQWFASYLRTLIERDVRDLGNIDGLTQLPQLLKLLAAESGHPLNIDSLSRASSIPATTLRRYLDLLGAVFLVQMLPAWTTSAATRLAKTSKAYLVDPGLTAYLMGLDEDGFKRSTFYPRLVEAFVACELMRLAGQSSRSVEVFHLRTVRQKEVPFVLEAWDGRLAGVALATSSDLREGDAEGLNYFAEVVMARFARGVVLYPGTVSKPINPQVIALPYAALWS